MRKTWKGGSPRKRGQLQVLQPLFCLSTKISIGTGSCSGLTCTARRSCGPQQSGKAKALFFKAWSQAATIHFNRRGILIFFFFSLFIFSKPWGHCNPQPLYFVLPLLQTESQYDLLLMFEWISSWGGIPNVGLVSHTK